MLYLTFVAILAVDFPIFPRRFVKTEVRGYSVMDLARGGIVCDCRPLCLPESTGEKQSFFHKSYISDTSFTIYGIVTATDTQRYWLSRTR